MQINTINDFNSTIHRFSTDNCALNSDDIVEDSIKKDNYFILKTKSQLNKIIVSDNNSPDYLAINLYWDSFRSWHTPKKTYDISGNLIEASKLKTLGLNLSYSKLIKTHGCSRETIRKKLVKLEKLGLINRDFHHKHTATTNSYNHMTIYVWKNTPLFFNKYGVDNDKISKLTPQTNHKYIEKKHNIVFASQAIENKEMGVGEGTQQLEGTKELNTIFINKNRSRESNFENSNLKEEKESCKPELKPITEKTVKPIKKTSLLEKVKTALCKKPKQLKDFYPLNANDCYYLQKSSGRDFTVTAMNEILLDMSKRLTDPVFYSKKGFLAYMSKAFMYEMRDAVVTSTENYKIRSNQTESELTEYIQEKYLTELEYNLQVSPEWHLKKKLAAVLERNTAYNLLTSYQSIEIYDGIANLTLDKNIKLTNLQQELILSQVKATHEAITDGYKITQLELNMPIESETIQRNDNQQLTLEREGKWGSIRTIFASYFGEKGNGLDISWLSKLEPTINENTKNLQLKAPSELCKDYVNQNLLPQLKSAIAQCGLELTSIEC